MSERIPAAVAKLVVFRSYLSSDHVTPATGKTIAITISKNGAAFGNPNVGALNATEISSGFYKFTLDTTDTGTTGPLTWRGAAATIDDAADIYSVVSANNAGFAGIPDATAGAANGLLISGANSGTTTLGSLTVTGAFTNNGTVDVAQTGDSFARIGAAGAGLTAVVAASVTGAVGSVTGLTASNLDATVSSRLATAGYTTPPSVATILTTAITEAYRANGAAPTLAQFISEVLAHLGESAIVGTTKTLNKLDHATAAETFTLDSATTPSTVTRAT